MNLVGQKLHQELNHKKVLLLGLGRQGGAKVANRLAQLGAHVRVSDLQSPEALAESVAELLPQIELHLGSHDPADVTWADLVVKNPAVPYSHPLIEAAEQNNIPITSETALAFKFVRDRVIGITGTRGKTTTTNLIWHILTQAGRAVRIGGNIPQQPTLETVLEANDEDWFVLELSSFQLETLDREKLSPRIAVLTSLSPDHLNRYGSMENYVDTKGHIFRWQQPGDAAFWIEQPEWQERLLTAVPGDVSQHVLKAQDIQIQVAATPTPLLGEHNQANVALAATVARFLQVEETVLDRAVGSFFGVPYRQQLIATNDGLRWINDTTATTPTALLTALRTYQGQPVVLITGGTTKQLPFPSELLEILAKMSESIVWLDGSGTQELLAKLNQKDAKKCHTLSQAVEHAREIAQSQKTSTILFSPGFSSFEMFKNEFDRGDQFNALVQGKAHQPSET